MGIGRRTQEVINHCIDGARLKREKEKKDYVIMTQVK